VTRTKVSRRGFVLPAVLFSLAVLSTAAFALASEARTSTQAAANRASRARSIWLARGCLAIARAEAQRALSSRPDGLERDLVWRNLSREMRLPGDVAEACRLEVEAAGARANVNGLDSLELVRLLQGAEGGTNVEMRVSALLDWRDADDSPRAGGAERAWYRALGRVEPRNGPLRSWDELTQVRGFERAQSLRTLVSFEEDVVSLAEAPAAVIVAIAGSDPLVASHLVRARERARTTGAISDLFWSADSVIASRLYQALASLSERVTLTPAYWSVAAVLDDGNGAAVRVLQRWARTRDQVVLQGERLR
jgi:general secretion pathway protein K